MDLRDQFAMAALQGLLSSENEAYEDWNPTYWRDGEFLVDKLAQDAYQVADAMLRAKAAQPKKQIPVPKITSA